jgi:hypothetical protein
MSIMASFFQIVISYDSKNNKDIDIDKSLNRKKNFKIQTLFLRVLMLDQQT